jgi:hypothetical protein
MWLGKFWKFWKLKSPDRVFGHVPPPQKDMWAWSPPAATHLNASLVGWLLTLILIQSIEFTFYALRITWIYLKITGNLPEIAHEAIIGALVVLSLTSSTLLGNKICSLRFGSSTDWIRLMHISSLRDSKVSRLHFISYFRIYYTDSSFLDSFKIMRLLRRRVVSFVMYVKLT